MFALHLKCPDLETEFDLRLCPLLVVCLVVEDGQVSDSFGQGRIDQMLDDRPEMKGVFDEEHPLVEWMEF